MVVSDPTLYPDKRYLISKIHEVLGYSSDKVLFVEIKSDEGNVITTEELVDRYYADTEKYFELDSGVQEEYRSNGKIANESQEGKETNTESLHSGEEQSKNIYLLLERNNFLYSCYQNECAFNTNDEKDYHSYAFQKYTGIPSLGRYVEEEQQQPKEKQPKQSKRHRITCTVCFKPGAIRYINPRTHIATYEHRDEPPIGEYIRPNTGKKYFRYRRCTGGKMIESLQDLVEHGVGQRGRPKVRKQQVQQKVDK